MTDFLICLTWSAKQIQPKLEQIRKRQDIYWKILKLKLSVLAKRNHFNSSISMLLANGILDHLFSV